MVAPYFRFFKRPAATWPLPVTANVAGEGNESGKVLVFWCTSWDEQGNRPARKYSMRAFSRFSCAPIRSPLPSALA